MRNQIGILGLLASLVVFASCDQKGEVIYQQTKNFGQGQVDFEIPLQESRKDHRIYLSMDYRYVDSNEYSIEVRLTRPDHDSTFQMLREKKSDIAVKRPGATTFSRKRKEGSDEHRVFTFMPRDTGTYLIEAYQDMSISGANFGNVRLEVRK